MSRHTIRMPDVGEGVVEAEIVAWHVKPGDVIEEDFDVVDVMTDKATVEIPSPVSGKVVEIFGAAGDMIPVGSDILVIETSTEEADSSEVPPKIDAKPDAQPVQEKQPVAKLEEPKKQSVQTKTETKSPSAKLSSSSDRPLASPVVRQRALELDVDLSDVSGTGPAGRILTSDLEDFIAAGGRALTRTGQTSGASKRTGQTETKVIGLRRKIARNMEAAWKTPMITYVEEVDVTEVEALRQHLNASKKTEQTKLTLIPFLATALIAALRDVPQANAHYFPEDDRLIEFEGVHLGIAAATDKGLVVPVLKHAEAMDVWQLAENVQLLAEASRSGKATKDQLSGSTITITSLGAIGGIVTTPILNPPETAIIGVNKIVERPVFDGGGRIVPRKFMNLSSSFDHRIVDGYDAARLVQAIRERLETPAMLFM